VRRALGGIATGCALVLSCLLASPAGAITYAPVDQPGPALSIPQAQLEASLECTDDVAGATRTPVLLVHGTGSDPHHSFSWNYMPALTALGVPWCAVALPASGMDDIQVAGEYVVNAIRTMHAEAGRRIAVFGHSQGGMLPRWALRFWPETRAMVEDLVGFAPSNHGTDSGAVSCLIPCAPAAWQQRTGSEFIKALNSYQQTFPGVSYTVVYTHTDLIVSPNLDDNGRSSLHGGGGEIENVAIQDICPLAVSEHVGVGTYDPTAYALAIDALEHPGPADPSRIASSVCTQPAMPGVDPITGPVNGAAAAADLLLAFATYPPVPAEPPLRCYVTASCPSQGASARHILSP
jgi:triacylglycerol esterase/lipase EstA (alpha/beta hydrolase family)